MGATILILRTPQKSPKTCAFAHSHGRGRGILQSYDFSGEYQGDNMTNKRLTAMLAACALLSAGCSTSLKVYQVDDKNHKADSPGSILYALPKKTLLISATYVLTAC